MFEGRIKAVGRAAAVAALAMVGLSSTPAFAKTKNEIDAMGQAAIIDGDKAKGRDDAINDGNYGDTDEEHIDMDDGSNRSHGNC